MTGQDAYDGPLSALRGIWEKRTEPDTHARRCGLLRGPDGGEP